MQTHRIAWQESCDAREIQSKHHNTDNLFISFVTIQLNNFLDTPFVFFLWHDMNDNSSAAAFIVYLCIFTLDSAPHFSSRYKPSLMCNLRPWGSTLLMEDNVQHKELRRLKHCATTKVLTRRPPPSIFLKHTHTKATKPSTNTHVHRLLKACFQTVLDVSCLNNCISLCFNSKLGDLGDVNIWWGDCLDWGLNLMGDK